MWSSAPTLFGFFHPVFIILGGWCCHVHFLDDIPEVPRHDTTQPWPLPNRRLRLKTSSIALESLMENIHLLQDGSSPAQTSADLLSLLLGLQLCTAVNFTLRPSLLGCSFLPFAPLLLSRGFLLLQSLDPQGPRQPWGQWDSPPFGSTNCTSPGSRI